MDDVRVTYNATLPGTVGARAVTKGSRITVAPGAESSVSHELWHVAQQKRRGVLANAERDGRAINDDPVLEREADAFRDAVATGPDRSETVHLAASLRSTSSTGLAPFQFDGSDDESDEADDERGKPSRKKQRAVGDANSVRKANVARVKKPATAAPKKSTVAGTRTAGGALKRPSQLLAQSTPPPTAASAITAAAATLAAAATGDPNATAAVRKPKARRQVLIDRKRAADTAPNADQSAIGGAAARAPSMASKPNRLTPSQIASVVLTQAAQQTDAMGSGSSSSSSRPPPASPAQPMSAAQIAAIAASDATSRSAARSKPARSKSPKSRPSKATVGTPSPSSADTAAAASPAAADSLGAAGRWVLREHLDWHGAKQQGAISKTQGKRYEGPATMRRSRAEQVTRHTANLALNSVAAAQKAAEKPAPVEAQMSSVGGRVLINTNNRSSSETLVEQIRAAGSLYGLATSNGAQTPAMDKDLARPRRYQSKLAKVAANSRAWQANNAVGEDPADVARANAIMTAMRSGGVGVFDPNKPKSVAAELARWKDGTAPNVYVVLHGNSDVDNLHAERIQSNFRTKYLQDYESHLSTPPAGPKTPCLGCASNHEAVHPQLGLSTKFVGAYFEGGSPVTTVDEKAAARRIVEGQPAVGSVSQEGYMRNSDFPDSDTDEEGRVSYPLPRGFNVAQGGENPTEWTWMTGSGQTRNFKASNKRSTIRKRLARERAKAEKDAAAARKPARKSRAKSPAARATAAVPTPTAAAALAATAPPLATAATVSGQPPSPMFQQQPPPPMFHPPPSTLSTLQPVLNTGASVGASVTQPRLAAVRARTPKRHPPKQPTPPGHTSASTIAAAALGNTAVSPLALSVALQQRMPMPMPPPTSAGTGTGLRSPNAVGTPTALAGPLAMARATLTDVQARLAAEKAAQLHAAMRTFSMSSAHAPPPLALGSHTSAAGSSVKAPTAVAKPATNVATPVPSASVGSTAPKQPATQVPPRVRTVDGRPGGRIAFTSARKNRPVPSVFDD